MLQPSDVTDAHAAIASQAPLEGLAATATVRFQTPPEPPPLPILPLLTPRPHAVIHFPLDAPHFGI